MRDDGKNLIVFEAEVWSIS